MHTAVTSAIINDVDVVSEAIRVSARPVRIGCPFSSRTTPLDPLPASIRGSDSPFTPTRYSS